MNIKELKQQLFIEEFHRVYFTERLDYPLAINTARNATNELQAAYDLLFNLDESIARIKPYPTPPNMVGVQLNPNAGKPTSYLDSEFDPF